MLGTTFVVLLPTLLGLIYHDERNGFTNDEIKLIAEKFQISSSDFELSKGTVSSSQDKIFTFYGKLNNMNELEKNYSSQGSSYDGRLLYINNKNSSISCKLKSGKSPCEAEFELFDEYDKELAELFD